MQSSKKPSNRYDAPCNQAEEMHLRAIWFLCDPAFHQCIPAERPHSPFAFCFRGGAWHPDFSKVNCRRSRRTGWTENSSRWRAAARGGTTKGGCSDAEERVLWRASVGSVILQRGVTARWGLKMNSLLLLSLFATVFAGKSPRLKFVVHGRQSSIFWLWFGFSSKSLKQICFINQLRV